MDPMAKYHNNDNCINYFAKLLEYSRKEDEMVSDGQKEAKTADVGTWDLDFEEFKFRISNLQMIDENEREISKWIKVYVPLLEKNYFNMQ